MYRVLVDYNQYTDGQDKIVIWDNSTVGDNIVEFTTDEAVLLAEFITIIGYCDGIFSSAIIHTDMWDQTSTLVRGGLMLWKASLRTRLKTSDFSEAVFDTLFDPNLRFIHGSAVKAIITDRVG